MSWFDWEVRDQNEYVQCLLRKGDCEHRSWIPKEFAVVGKILKIHFNKWENGWEVISAGKNVMSGNDLDDSLEGGYRAISEWSKRDLLVRQVSAKMDEVRLTKRQKRLNKGDFKP